MNYGKLIKELREKHKLSQAELSRISGVSQALISKLESGHVNPRCSSITSLLHALGYELKLIKRRTKPVSLKE